MIQQECGIERRIAEMDDLKIDGHDLVSVDEEVLGTPISVGQATAPGRAIPS
jgi:hypothetical protein